MNKTKKCTSCKINKNISCFNKNRTKKDGRHNVCKNCNKKVAKKHYNKNKKECIDKNLSNRLKKQEYVWEYLSNHPCEECGESDILYLEFDHIKDKKFSISRLIRQGASLDNIKKEISKCQILCLKCHRLKTATDFKWKVLNSEYRKENKI